MPQLRSDVSIIRRCIVCRREADSEPGHGYYHATCSCPGGQSWAYVYACAKHFDNQKSLHRAHLKHPEQAMVYRRGRS